MTSSFPEHTAGALVAHENYSVVAPLGRGAQGQVFRVRRRREGDEAALKLVSSRSADQVLALKHEFRARRGVEHENLVRFFEFEVSDTVCYFTMELVDGLPFDQYCEEAAERGSGNHHALVATLVRDVLAGLAALDRSGVVHRDLKPDNVLVNVAGRVSIVDFGFALTSRDNDDDPAGSARYMAPEVAFGSRATISADVHALGVMAYEALVGHPPFAGTSLAELMTHKLARSKVELPPELSRGLPVLSELIAGWLNPDPTRRLSPHESLRLLGDSHATGPAGFVGRDAELQALLSLDPRGAALVTITGESGIGKTTLLERYAEVAEERVGGLTLWSSCFPFEHVPFNAIDGLVDGLRSVLEEAPEILQDPALAEVLGPLGRVFPLLSAGSERDAARYDPGLLSGASAGLVRVLKLVAQRQPLRLVIDDYQWADSDSYPFLSSLLAATLPVTLIVVARDLSPGAASRLSVLQDAAREQRHRVFELELTGLSEADVSALLPDSGPAKRSQLVAISDGNPFMLNELAQADSAHVSDPVDALLDSRCAAMTPEAREFLTYVALAHAPLPLRALGALPGWRDQRELWTERLVKGGAAAGEPALMVAHDRIRECLARRASPAQVRKVNQQLAAVFETSQPPAAAAAAAHHEAAGNVLAATDWWRVAAEHAAVQAAWSAAADHFARAAALADDNLDLLRSWARALGAAGKPVQAGDAWLALGKSSEDPMDVLRGAEQYFSAGALALGHRAIAPVTKLAGWRMPRTPLAKVLTATWWQLRGKGLDPVTAAASADPSVSARQQLRNQLGWTTSGSLGIADTMTSFASQKRYYFEAMQSRDSAHVARSLATEYVYTLARGRHTAELESIGHALTTLEDGQPAAVQAYIALARGYGAHLVGEVADASRHFIAARSLYRELGAASWEREMLERSWIWTRRFLGQYENLAIEVSNVLNRADTEQYRLTQQQMSCLGTIVDLARDEPDRASRDLDKVAADGQMPQATEFVYEHARLDVELYQGDWQAAGLRLKRAARKWWLHRQFLHMRCEYYWFSAAIALQQSRRQVGITTARRVAASFQKETFNLPRAMAAALEGAADSRADRLTSARENYLRAAELFESMAQLPHAHAARLHAAGCGGTEQEAEGSRRVIQAMGVADVGRWLRMIMPGPALEA